MAYQKFNKDKVANIKMGQFYDHQTMLQESAALSKEESKDIEINMLRESMVTHARSENTASTNILRKQKYLNESR